MKVRDATPLIQKSVPFVLNNKKEVRKAAWQEKIVFFFSPKYRTKEILKIIDIAADKLSKHSGDNDYQNLWKACVKRYQKDKKFSAILEKKERDICKECDDVAFTHFKNRRLENKMIRNGYDVEILRQHPDFILFLDDSGLLSQMKATRDTIEIIDNEPAILVEGQRMKWSELKDTFTWEKGPDYNNEKFIVHKEMRKVYTYLDTGVGLHKYHPYIDENLTAISTLDDDDYEKTLKTAKKFVRQGEDIDDVRETKNENRDFILQIVTSKTNGTDTNYHNLISRSRHSYIRLIIGNDNDDIGTKKGEVYEVGFGHYGNFSNFSPLSTGSGKFRSPDVWEYMRCEERIVTNIAIEQKEANDLYHFIIKYHNERNELGKRIGFNLLSQNCTVFVRKATKAAGVKLPTKIELSDLIYEIAPDKIRKVGKMLENAHKKIVNLEGRAAQILPKKVKNFLTRARRALLNLVKKVIQSVASLFLLPINFLLGGLKGENGEAFTVDGEKSKEKVGPPLKNVSNWHKISTYRLNLPGILQRWQRQQPSTEIYQDPIKFAIVPN